MGSASIRPFVDKLMDGQLADRLAAWRAEGLSYNAIAGKLDEVVDYRVTAETVRMWCRDMHVPGPSDDEDVQVVA